MKKVKVKVSVTPKNTHITARINKDLKELFLETLKEEGIKYTEWLEERMIEYLKEREKI